MERDSTHSGVSGGRLAPTQARMVGFYRVRDGALCRACLKTQRRQRLGWGCNTRADLREGVVASGA